MANDASNIREVLQAEREAFCQKYSGLPEGQRNQRWSEYVAHLASSVSSSPTSHDFQRTTSNGGYSSQHNISSLRIPPSMDRSSSATSTQSAPACTTIPTFYGNTVSDGAGPFPTIGDYNFRLHSVGSQNVITDWKHDFQAPFSSYTMGSHSARDSFDVDDCGYELDCTNLGGAPDLSTIQGIQAPISRRDSQQLSVSGSAQFAYASSPYSISSGGSPDNTTPTTGELMPYSAITSTSMSRHSSIASSVTPAFNRLHVHPVSDSSNFVSIPNTEVTLSTGNARFAVGESNCSPLFPLSHSDEFLYSSSPSFTQQSASFVQTKVYPTQEMRRSSSNQSNNSGTSNKSRVSQRLGETLLQSSRRIAPKESTVESASMSRASSNQKASPSPMGDGCPRNVAAIAKITTKNYIRPRHAKIPCLHCDKYPEGFRGEHELRRHVDSQHSKVKKVWICVDPSESKTFLASCKQCRNQKQYGAYYNAAAHLRRAHFHPRKRGRKSRNDSEKRGGKGGGNDPPMAELKKWMKEIEVLVTPDLRSDSQEYDSDDAMIDNNECPPTSEDMISNPSQSAFDTPISAPTSSSSYPPTSHVTSMGQNDLLFHQYDHFYPDSVPSEINSLGYAPMPHSNIEYPDIMVFDGQQQFGHAAYPEPFVMEMPRE